ncbi:putative leucine-rich repeat-containing protein DDB_G0290503 [Octopus sinensis]|uniref:Leucine-rich repeat-containing protein DDB_G0290503 n=1 Tax=Octopus sinensis TaxID=2607531 RepID=A0A6P7U8H1_9MOLL|nr:putative leucine-rich repeat-containing protein DDB_G0290503 [Octopus sinensis]
MCDKKDTAQLQGDFYEPISNKLNQIGVLVAERDQKSVENVSLVKINDQMKQKDKENEDKIAKLEAELTKCIEKSRLVDTLQSELDEINKSRETVALNLTQKTSDFDSLSNNFLILESQFFDLKDQKNLCDQKVAELDKERTNLNKVIKERQIDYTNLEMTVHRLQSEVNQINEQKTCLVNQMQSQMDFQKQLTCKLESCQSAKEQLLKNFELEKTTNSKLRDQNDSLAAQNLTLSSQNVTINELMNKITKERDNFEQINSRNSDWENAYYSLEAQFGHLQSKRENDQQTLGLLNEENKQLSWKCNQIKNDLSKKVQTLNTEMEMLKKILEITKADYIRSQVENSQFTTQLQNEIQTLKQEFAELHTNFCKLSQERVEIDQLSNLNDSLQVEILWTHKAKETLSFKVDELESENTQYKELLHKLELDRKSINELNSRLNTEKDEISERVNSLQQQNMVLESHLKAVNQQQAQVHRDVWFLREENDTIKAQLHLTEENLSTTMFQCHQLKCTNDELYCKIEELDLLKFRNAELEKNLYFINLQNSEYLSVISRLEQVNVDNLSELHSKESYDVEDVFSHNEFDRENEIKADFVDELICNEHGMLLETIKTLQKQELQALQYKFVELCVIELLKQNELFDIFKDEWWSLGDISKNGEPMENSMNFSSQIMSCGLDRWGYYDLD